MTDTEWRKDCEQAQAEVELGAKVYSLLRDAGEHGITWRDLELRFDEHGETLKNAVSDLIRTERAVFRDGYLTLQPLP